MSGGRTDQQSGRVARAAAEGERRPGLRAIGIAASRLAAPIVARHGGGRLARLKAEWPAVIGADLAALTWPEALTRDGVLKLRVAGAIALELQHRAPLVIERINLYFGRAAVSRLVLVQGPLPLAPPSAPATAPPLADAEARALDHQLAAVGDPALRAALGRLGRRIVAGARRGH